MLTLELPILAHLSLLQCLGLHVSPTPGSQQEVSMLGMEYHPTSPTNMGCCLRLQTFLFVCLFLF